MREKLMTSLIAAAVLVGSLAYGYDEGGSSPHTTKFGEGAGANNTESGYYNAFTGYQSGYNNTSGDHNVFTGYQSGYNNTGGSYNVFTGHKSGYSNTSGLSNTFSGHESGYSNMSGNYNVFIGYLSGHENTTGKKNVFTGSNSGYYNTSGYYNVFTGYLSGNKNTTGHSNTFIGFQSGSNADVNNSIFLGCQAGRYATRENTLYIANSDTDKPLIYGEFDTGLVKVNGRLQSTRKMTALYKGQSNKDLLTMQELRVNNTKTGKRSDVSLKLSNVKAGFSWNLRTQEGSQGVMLSKSESGANEMKLYNSTPDDGTSVILELANGAYCDGVWHDTSSRSMKKDIKDLDAKAAMEAFRKLRPVTYAYKANPADPKVGFIAEEVPELVADPGRKSLSPMDMVALLTKVVQGQEKTLDKTRAELKKKDVEMAAMKAEIEKLKKMKESIARLESLLTNLALKTAPESARLSSRER